MFIKDNKINLDQEYTKEEVLEAVKNKYGEDKFKKLITNQK
jgi:hypothetical protein